MHTTLCACCYIYWLRSYFYQCTIEWFHYGCVGITEPPKGKWYCPQCSLSMKKKGRQKEHKL